MYKFITLKMLALTSLSFIFKQVDGQDFALPVIIENCKKSIVPIIGQDSIWGNSYRHLGTAVVISNKKTDREVIVTCRHVIGAKDNLSKHDRPVNKLFANLNLVNDSIIKVPLIVLYVDSTNDFAILSFDWSKIKKPIDS